MSDLPYRVLADNLRARIRTGEFPVGSVLPGKLDLAERSGVSHETAAKALHVLAEEGLVRSVPHTGTVVLDPTTVVLTDRPDGHRLGHGWHDLARVTVLEPPPQQIGRLFGRRRPQGVAYRVGGEQVEQLATVWRVGRAPVEQTEETVSTRLPSATEARALGVSARTPVLRVLRVGRADTTVVEVTDIVLPGRYELRYPAEVHALKGKEPEPPLT